MCWDHPKTCKCAEIIWNVRMCWDNPKTCKCAEMRRTGHFMNTMSWVEYSGPISIMSMNTHHLSYSWVWILTSSVAHEYEYSLGLPLMNTWVYSWFVCVGLGLGLRVSERSPQGLTFFCVFSHASKRCSSTKSLNVVQVFRCGQDVFVLVQNMFSVVSRRTRRVWFRLCVRRWVAFFFAFRLTFVRMTTENIKRWTAEALAGIGLKPDDLLQMEGWAGRDGPGGLRGGEGASAGGHIEHVHKLRLLFVFVHDPVWMLRTVCFCSHILSNVF